jgi:hypothetical protein
MTIEIPAFAALIAALVAWITYKNHQLAAEKLKLDLFEKRFAVFRAAQLLLTRVFEDGAMKELKAVFEYRRDTQVAFFLFGPEIESYLSELDKKAVWLWSMRESYKELPAGADRTQLCTKEGELLLQLLDELPKLKVAFSPYLRFKTWH